jgi:methyl-accepting chemotaxis protein
MACGNAFQALVDPPHDGNNLSCDGGDERTDGSDDNTIVNVCPRDSGMLASQELPHVLLPALGNIQDRLEHLHNMGMAIGHANRTNTELIEAVLDKASDNNNECFDALNSKMESLLQKMDATWTENTALYEAYRAGREETVMLKATVDTLTTKLDEHIAISTPPSPETVTTSTAMEEMTMQLSHMQNHIQHILDAVRNPRGKRKQRTTG